MARVEPAFNFDLSRLRQLRGTPFFCGVNLNADLD